MAEGRIPKLVSQIRSLPVDACESSDLSPAKRRGVVLG